MARHKWSKELRMKSHCDKCGAIRDRTQLTPKYQMWNGETIFRLAPICVPSESFLLFKKENE